MTPAIIIAKLENGKYKGTRQNGGGQINDLGEDLKMISYETCVKLCNLKHISSILVKDKYDREYINDIVNMMEERNNIGLHYIDNIIAFAYKDSTVLFMNRYDSIDELLEGEYKEQHVYVYNPDGSLYASDDYGRNWNKIGSGWNTDNVDEIENIKKF